MNRRKNMDGPAIAKHMHFWEGWIGRGGERETEPQIRIPTKTIGQRKANDKKVRSILIAVFGEKQNKRAKGGAGGGGGVVNKKQEGMRGRRKIEEKESNTKAVKDSTWSRDEELENRGSSFFHIFINSIYSKKLCSVATFPLKPV